MLGVDREQPVTSRTNSDAGGREKMPKGLWCPREEPVSASGRSRLLVLFAQPGLDDLLFGVD